MLSRVAGSAQARAQEVVYVFSSSSFSSSVYTRGIVYFATHRALWRPFLSRVVPTLTVQAAVTVPMFMFTYLPQLSVLVWVYGPLAVVSTALLVLNESSAIASIFTRNLILKGALLDTFDATLVSRGAAAAVREGREVHPGSDPVAKLGKVLKSPLDGFSFGRYLLHLWLNLIPLVGTFFFIVLQGRARGLGIHERYFQLKAWSKGRKSDWFKLHVGSYTAFGVVANLLEMVPVASMLFSFTNTVGAALWAADVEEMDMRVAEQIGNKKYR
ncbi:hypothetical protein MAPG_10771 [Magnaporthiopsis poae ATCC 64411]|uniref:Outer spore wall protein RRT8 n=1 Tax=Magnaporthiopsis poae (strain ATCC 64411 / 73-15) TaxID=644358 RepID=A0A0C4EDH2_MAGP6|nr:hypothetical protein MAPG_10771 [Magnaporthiopsis poae ATCC 64411]